MKVTKSQLKNLIRESVKTHIKKEGLKNRLNTISEELNKLNEDGEMEVMVPEVSESSETIFDAKPGEILILNFEGRTLKLRRVWDALFLVTDGFESTHLNTGDYVELQGNPDLTPGREYTFKVYKPTRDVESSALQSWKIAKN
tara:strand:- start:452 stop:880 length:429 start_codon:yes stop_codon:yes gene_type:complete